VRPAVSPPGTAAGTPWRGASPWKRTVSAGACCRLTVVAGAARPGLGVGGVPWVRRGSVSPRPVRSSVSPYLGGPEAPGPVEEHDDDHDAVEEQAVHVEEPEALGQRDEQAGAEDAPADRVDTAADDHRDQQERAP